MVEQIPPEALNVPLKKTHIQNYKSVTTKVREEERTYCVLLYQTQTNTFVHTISPIHNQSPSPPSNHTSTHLPSQYHNPYVESNIL